VNWGLPLRSFLWRNARAEFADAMLWPTFRSTWPMLEGVAL